MVPKFATIQDMLIAMTREIRKDVGGTSGVLYDLFFTAISQQIQKEGASSEKSSSLSASSSSSMHDMIVCLNAGVEAVQKYGGARVGMRTMLDAMCPAIHAGFQASANQESPQQVISAMTHACEIGA